MCSGYLFQKNTGAMGQNGPNWYLFVDGYPPTVVYVEGFMRVHQGHQGLDP